MKLYKSIVKGLKQAIENIENIEDTNKKKKDNIYLKEIKKTIKSGMSIKSKIKDFKYSTKKAINRALYGYSDEDWFEFFYNYCCRNQKLFEEFRDNGVGRLWKYPNSILPDEATIIMSKKEQTQFFNNLIELLESIKDDNYLSKKTFHKELCDLSSEERCHFQVVQREEVKKYFNIMSEHFLQLWD